MHRRHNESPGHQGCGLTGGSQGAEGRGAVGGEYCKKQGGCVGFSDFMFTFARCRGGSGSCQRHLQERGGTDGGGQTTLQAAETMHQVTGTMRQVTGTMHQVTGTMHHGGRDYAPGRREQEQRTKDIYNIIRYACTNRQYEREGWRSSCGCTTADGSAQQQRRKS